jgi:hypothetical protein
MREAAQPAWSPLALRCLLLLSMIYFVDFKVVLGRFIQRWLREVTRINDVAFPWPLLHLPLYKDAQTLSRRLSLIQIKTQHEEN